MQFELWLGLTATVGFDDLFYNFLTIGNWNIWTVDFGFG